MSQATQTPAWWACPLLNSSPHVAFPRGATQGESELQLTGTLPLACGNAKSADLESASLCVWHVIASWQLAGVTQTLGLPKIPVLS